MCVCVNVCIYIYMYMFVHIHMCVGVGVWVYVWTCHPSEPVDVPLCSCTPVPRLHVLLEVFLWLLCDVDLCVCEFVSNLRELNPLRQPHLAKTHSKISTDPHVDSLRFVELRSEDCSWLGKMFLQHGLQHIRSIQVLSEFPEAPHTLARTFSTHGVCVRGQQQTHPFVSCWWFLPAWITGLVG